MSVIYFTGMTASDAAHPSATITVTSADDFYTIFKKALDLEFYPDIEVAAEALPPRSGAIPDNYILISLNGYNSIYVNGSPTFIDGLFDIVIVYKSATAFEALQKRVRDALLLRNFRETGNDGVMETDDTTHRVYRQEYVFRKGYNDG